MLARALALIAAGTASLASAPAAAETAAPNSFEVAAFCAGAALAAIPPPDGQNAPDAELVALANHWTARAFAGAAETKLDEATALEQVNQQTRALVEGFEEGVAPFYDLPLCEDGGESLLWSRVPARWDQEGSAWRPHPVSLDRLADDREIEVFRSMSGRLRPRYAQLSAREAFARDVRIIALQRALAAAQGETAGWLAWGLGAELQARQIGVGGLNIEHAIAALEHASGLLDAAGPRAGRTQSALCFAYLTRIGGSRADNLERAIAACRTALAGLDRPETREAWANTQLILAGALHDRMRGSRAANIENAIAADRAALSARSREADPVLWATTQINLGVHLGGRIEGERQDNIEAALAALDAAATVITPEFAPEAWQTLQNNRAPLLAERENGGLAANQEAAIGLLEPILASPLASGSLRSAVNYQLGEVYRRRLTGERRANLEEAVRRYRDAVLGDPLSERWPIVAGRALGGALIALGRFEEARDALKIAARAAETEIGLGIDEALLRDVLSDAADIYVLEAYALARLGKADEALAALSAGKARLLFTALSAADLDLPPAEKNELFALRGELQRREAEIERAVREESAGTATDTLAVVDLEPLRRRILELYAKGANARVAQPRLATLSFEGALIAPVITEFGALALVARSGGEVRSFDLPGLTRDRLQPLVERISRRRQAAPLKPPEDRELDVLQLELGALLGDGVRAALGAAGVAPGTPLTVLPDGPTAILPLGLARAGEGGRSLIEDFQLRFVPSIAALQASRRRAAGARNNRLGLLEAPDDAQLDFAAVEARMVEARFAEPARATWRQPGRAALLAGLGSKNYWHFATHGWFDWEDPRSSGVVIGRGGEKLTLGDLLETREQIGSPRLVVLSACSTGVSEVGRNPEEFFGLPTGYLFAGAAGVVASLWPVNDLSTAFLMGKFYDLHLAEGAPPARALRAAQLWLKDATVAELRSYVAAKQQAGALPAQQATLLLDELEVLGINGDGARPFAAPKHWGAFVIYGE